MQPHSFDKFAKLANELFRRLNIPDPIPPIHWLLETQKYGGWGEEGRVQEDEELSPQATGEAILALLPKAVENDKIQKCIREALNFLLQPRKCDDTRGWDDLSGGYTVVDSTGAAVTALSKCQQTALFQNKNNIKRIQEGVDFLVEQQNDEDGGWGVRKGDKSKIQYFFWAMRGLTNASKLGLSVGSAINRGLEWIKQNRQAHRGNALGITIDLPENVIATSKAVVILEELGHGSFGCADWLIEKFEDGSWREIATDATSFRKIPRRVYDLSGPNFPILALLHEGFSIFDNNIQMALMHIHKLARPSGGYAHRENYDAKVWMTYFIIDLADNLEKRVREDPAKHLNLILYPEQGKEMHVLMPGRFQPPHLGHIEGLKSLLERRVDGFEGEPSQIREILAKCTSVIIGIAKTSLDKDNPLTRGERRALWERFLHDESIRQRKSLSVEVIGIPAEKNVFNIVEAIHETIQGKDRIIVATGNGRVANQCERNNIPFLKFKRKDVTKFKGEIIRRKILEWDEESDDVLKAKIEQEIECLVGPSFFSIFRERNLLSTMAKVIGAK